MVLASTEKPVKKPLLLRFRLRSGLASASSKSTEPLGAMLTCIAYPPSEITGAVIAIIGRVHAAREQARAGATDQEVTEQAEALTAQEWEHHGHVGRVERALFLQPIVDGPHIYDHHAAECAQAPQLGGRANSRRWRIQRLTLRVE